MDSLSITRSAIAEIVWGVWLGTEDSNPDLLIQSQLSYH